ncbi:MAG TPA: nitroreductase family protein [Oscillospiraceae bacterium]|nr:nitroreductase family protein [Oscillospiraceae bacterium]
MTSLEAVDARHSHRKYQATPIESSIVEKLKASVEQYNKEAGLHIQFITDNGEAFNGLTKSYGMFSGVQNYIALIGRADDENFKEKCGYYGEKLVLEATQFGLGTCWVGGSFNKKFCSYHLSQGETLCCTITMGNVEQELSFKEKLIIKTLRGKSKSIDEMYESSGEVPQWFLSGMQAVQKAPSAMNQQPVKFYYKNGVVSASVKDISAHQPIDMGIAKLHFEVGSGGGTWAWGNHSEFTKL